MTNSSNQDKSGTAGKSLKSIGQPAQIAIDKFISITSNLPFLPDRNRILKPQVSQAMLEKWQDVVNAMARVLHVPAGLIMRVDPPEIEVFVSSVTSGNPYKLGERASLNTGLYCETVMASRAPLLVHDALREPDWDQNPDIELGMTFYHGLPLEWPDGQIFGTICVLDNEDNQQAAEYRDLLLSFRGLIETDLRFLIEKAIREEEERVLKREKTRLTSLVHLGTRSNLPEAEFIKCVLEEIVRLTESKFGYLHLINANQDSIQLYTWSDETLECYSAREQSYFSLDEVDIWSHCMRIHRPVVQNDYQYSRDRKGIPGWPNITRHACAPIVEDNRIVAIVGVGDKEACYDEMDTTQMTLFAGSMWTLLQRQRAETELRILNAELDKRVQQATAELRLLLDSTAEAICGLNLKGDCTFCNPAFLRTLGYDGAHRVVGQNLHEIVHHTDPDGKACPREKCRIYQALGRGEGVHLDDESFCRADGSCFPIECWCYPIHREGQVVGMVLTFLDITERKRTEEEKAVLQKQLNQAQKMEAIGELASGIAHDFNNLLTVIMANIKLLKGKIGADDSIRESLDAVSEASHQAAGVTRSLLTFSHKQTVEKTDINLCDAVEKASRMLKRALPDSIELAIDTTCDPAPWITGDETQIQQILLNLAVNARDAMPEGGRLSIHVYPPTSVNAGIRESTSGKSSFTRIIVEDTGSGMSPDVQSRIFDPFFTTKPRGQGTGLGLSIIHSMVANHMGTIEIESKEGRGSTFTITLPCVIRESVEQEAVAETFLPKGNEELIILAEDHQQVREIVVITLVSSGYQVEYAGDGETLLELIEQYQSTSRLLIVDADIPRRSGFSCMREIRSKGINTPAIIMTGNVDITEEDVAEIDATLLRKPFDLEEMKKMVQTAILVS